MDDLIVLAVLIVGMSAVLCLVALVGVVMLTGWMTRPAVDNYATARSIVVMNDDTTMTTTEVRELLGLKTNTAARVQLRRWRISATGRVTDTGEKRWDRAQVEKSHANRAGRGARTDLRTTTIRTILNAARAADYITVRRNSTGPEGAGQYALTYELRAPSAAYDEISRIITGDPGHVGATVVDNAHQPHLTVFSFRLTTAVDVARAILAAGIQLTLPTRES